VPRIDDYKEALRIAKEKLAVANVHHLAKLSGGSTELNEDGSIDIRLTFLNQPCTIRVNPTTQEVSIWGKSPEDEISLTDQILIAHYVLNASGEPATGEWITFRDIPDGHFYYDAFQRRARDPFLKAFGEDPELFAKVAPMIGGSLADDIGDITFVFQVFPRIAVKIVLWRGDDEFPPEATVLFDRNIDTYLPAEDIAYMSGGIVYRMMGIARSLKQR